MKKILTLILIAAILVTLVACTEKAPVETTGKTDNISTPDSPLDKELEIRVSVLSGTTGMGAAPLIKSAKDGNEELNYKFSIATAADQIGPGIIKGEIDIAAVPTNLAATLYNKTEGKIQVLAGNTKGVLYLLSKDTSIKTVNDLKGKTVHVPGKGTNPEYLLRYVLEANGLKVGSDVTIDYTYTSPDELKSAVSATDTVKIALLPEPKVSAATSKTPELKAVIDITKEWNTVSNGTDLLQGCIIARKEFVDAHPNEVAEFMKQYKNSVESVIADPKASSLIIEEVGIIPKAALAEKAIPNCNLCFITGEELKEALNKLFTELYALEPQSVGGAVPNDGIYYMS